MIVSSKTAMPKTISVLRVLGSADSLADHSADTYGMETMSVSLSLFASSEASEANVICFAILRSRLVSALVWC